MEIAGIRVALGQLRDALVIAYSVLVVATVVPGFGHVSSAIAIPYYLSAPGYYAARLLRNTPTIIEGLFYSVGWSLAIVASVYSIATLGGSFSYIPISILIPAITVVLLAYGRSRQ